MENMALEILEEYIEEMKSAPEQGTFSKDYLQGQAVGMLRALCLLDVITPEQSDEFRERIFAE